MDIYPAHIKKKENGKDEIQSVCMHCRRTAEYASAAMQTVGLSQSAYLAGLLHDMGKYTDAFRNYLIRRTNGENVRTGSVNHTFAGVRFLLEGYHGKGEPYGAENVSSELLCLAVGAHHGLFDCADEQQKNGFTHRAEKPDIGYTAAVSAFLQNCADKTETDTRFKSAAAELSPIYGRIFEMTDNDEDTAFYMGLLARLLTSAVIDGDRRDTAEFLNDAVFPTQRDGEALRKMWEACLVRTERKLREFPQDTEIQRARGKISDACRAFAERESGIFRLHVPTGGGKTLSSLRYALAHAAKYGKQHIFFVSPLLSILEQNAHIVRDFIGDDSLILEHHSNLVKTEAQDDLDENELLTETYDAPIIITTLVQLLNTLFSGKTTAIRRFHALANSVLVIDEVQTVPSNMLSLFTLAVNFLSKICGTAVILCSATQPHTQKLKPLLLESTESDMVPYDEKLWQCFRRTEIKDIGSLSLAEIADLARKSIESVSSLLLICNKKSEARELYEALKDFGGVCRHLSASMCIAHRKTVLEEVQSALCAGEKTICVSTQLIEAGVDISFEQVLRLSAGMDSVVQATGRCNRNGEAGKGKIAPVLLVNCRGETLKGLSDIQKGKAATSALLCEFQSCPSDYQNDLASSEAIQFYYNTLYSRMEKGQRDYPLGDKNYTLRDLLSRNNALALPSPYYFRQAFKTAGARFRVFSEDTTDVLVPYGDGKDILEELKSERAKHDPCFVKSLLDKAKPYTVSLYAYQATALERAQALLPLNGGATELLGHYDEETGFSAENRLDFLEV